MKNNNVKMVELYIKGKEDLIIKSERDFADIVSKSPYSHKSEVERRLELEKSVAEAKAALKTFSYQQKSAWLKFRELFIISR